MAVPDSASPVSVVADVLDDDTRDLFRRMLRDALQQLIEAELTATIGALPRVAMTARPSRTHDLHDRGDQLIGQLHLAAVDCRAGSFGRMHVAADGLAVQPCQRLIQRGEPELLRRRRDLPPEDHRAQRGARQDHRPDHRSSPPVSRSVRRWLRSPHRTR